MLTTAKDHVTASLIEGLLATNGIECHLDRSNPAPGAFLKPFGDPLAPIPIFVAQVDFESASLVLHEVEHVAPDPQDFPPRVVRRIWWITIAVVLVVALLTLLETFDFAPCVIRVFCF